MHETSLGNTILDYLTGEQIEETTYEEFRQALARLLVEEKGFPKTALKAKQEIRYTIDGQELARAVDLAAYSQEGKPLLIVIFCAGKVGSYEREASVAARLFPDGPAPFALVTDTKDAALLRARDGQAVAHGMRAVPHWDDLVPMAADEQLPPLTADQKAKLERIFHTYSGFLTGCCQGSCE